MVCLLSGVFISPSLWPQHSRALAAGRSVIQGGCSPEGISASGFGYPFPLGQAACWPLPELGGGQATTFSWVWVGKFESPALHCAGSPCVGLWRGRELASLQMGPCLFLALEGKDRGFALRHSSALPHTLSLELAAGEVHAQG